MPGGWAGSGDIDRVKRSIEMAWNRNHPGVPMPPAPPPPPLPGQGSLAAPGGDYEPAR
jgi:hypothetical protein